jgi:peptidoglycan/xylan/chitin deacetylase (PgdA/CDA1 family)
MSAAAIAVASCSSEPAPVGDPRGGDSLGVHSDPLSVDPSVPFLDFDQNADDPKAIALTFDDAPDATNTRKILDALKAAGVKATFFINTKNYVDVSTSSAARGLIVRMNAEGHEIGNHTVHHYDLGASSTNVTSELDGVDQLMKTLVPGARQQRLVRAPYGNPYFGPQARLDYVAPIVAKYGVHVGWNIDPEDYNCATTSCVLNGVLGPVDSGLNGLVLLHATQSRTAAALPSLISSLRSRGMRFVLVEELVQSKYGKPSRQLIFCATDADCVSGETCGANKHCAAASGGGGDAGVIDSGTSDSGVSDSGHPDSTVADAGSPDTGQPDSTVVDSGSQDAGSVDSTLVDSGSPDTGRPDSTPAESGPPDTGSPDSGVDAADAAADGGEAGGVAQLVYCSTTTTTSGSLQGGSSAQACGASGALATKNGVYVVWSESSTTTKTVAYATYVLTGTPTSLKVDVAFRGDDSTEPLWYWSIWNPSTGAWVQIGDNAWAGNWSTTAHQFVVAGPAAYVDATGHVKIRFQTKTSTNSAEMDRMVLEVTY